MHIRAALGAGSEKQYDNRKAPGTNRSPELLYYFQGKLLLVLDFGSRHLLHGGGVQSVGQLGAIGLKAVLQLTALHIGEGLCAEAV